MNETAPAAELPYHDRSVGLVIFGILTILLGCAAAGLCLLMLVGTMINTGDAATQTSPATLIPVVAVYAILAVALVWLGIGSILARRWARALLLIFSWTWLIAGVFGMLAMAALLPKLMHNFPVPPGRPALPPGALEGVMIFAFILDGFFLVVLPAIWTYFYSSRHVKGTVEWRNPNPGWTDACPLPVLAGCLWAISSSVMLPMMAFTSYGVAPFFGMFLTGLPGTIFFLFIAGMQLIAAGMMYRMDVRGWWLFVAVFLTFMISSIVTYSRHDFIEVYQLMKFPDAQIDQVKKSGIFEGHSMAWISGFCMLPYLGFLLFIKRYFRR
jgi:hypothetical protein